MATFNPYEQTPYKVLGVPESAVTWEIRYAYHNLIGQYHPDKNKNPEATQRAVEIIDAYKVLSDDTTRASYDQNLREYRSYGKARKMASSTLDEILKEAFSGIYSKKTSNIFMHDKETMKYVETHTYISGFIGAGIPFLLSGIAYFLKVDTFPLNALLPENDIAFMRSMDQCRLGVGEALGYATELSLFTFPVAAIYLTSSIAWLKHKLKNKN